MRRLGFLPVTLFIFTGCALSSLGDNLEQESCINQPFSFCDELNQISPLDDPQKAWTCNTASGFCEVGDFDEDRDGSGVLDDCDDKDPTRTPGADELCDGIDNDCDDTVDEGAYTIVEQAMPALTEGTDVIFDSFSIGQNPTTLNSVLIYQTNSLPRTAVLLNPSETVTQFGPLMGESPNTNLGNSQSVAITHENGNFFKTLVGSSSGSRPLLVGDIESPQVGSALTLSDQNSNALSTSVGASATMLSAEKSGFDVIGTYQERTPNPGDGCGTIVNDSAGLEDILIFDAHTPFDQQSPIVLGKTKDPSAAAAVSINAQEWLVAYANGEDQGISIRHITLNSSTGEITISNSDSDASLEIAANAVVGDVTIARSEDGSKIAVAARVGCGASNISISVMDYDATQNTLTLVQSTELTRIGAKAEPSILWRESPTQGWFLTFQEAATRSVVMMLDPDGNQIGSSPPLVANETDSGTHKSGSHLLRAQNDDFAVLSPIHNIASASEIKISIIECTNETN